LTDIEEAAAAEENREWTEEERAEEKAL